MESELSDFLRKHHQGAVSTIRRDLAVMPVVKRKQTLIEISKLLESGCEDVPLRDGAARAIIALLPESMTCVTKVLADRTARFWYEIHFIMFAALEREDFTLDEQREIETILAGYIRDVNRTSGFAAWKAGDVLGEEWRNGRTVNLLQDLLTSATYAAGRLAAIHGLAHAMKASSGPARREIRAMLEKASLEDCSTIVRKAADYVLRSDGCGA
jgi:hypothetical protein